MRASSLEGLADGDQLAGQRVQGRRLQRQHLAREGQAAGDVQLQGLLALRGLFEALRNGKVYGNVEEFIKKMVQNGEE